MDGAGSGEKGTHIAYVPTTCSILFEYANLILTNPLPKKKCIIILILDLRKVRVLEKN